MNTSDTRWVQRLESYTNALSELTDAVHTRSHRTLSRLEAMGLIHAFEFTYELGWNVLKDYLIYQGVSELVGSRDTIRSAGGAVRQPR
jgi:nucleotidyltransferase substrate binding protein (TIGR01987 family)